MAVAQVLSFTRTHFSVAAVSDALVTGNPCALEPQAALLLRSHLRRDTAIGSSLRIPMASQESPAAAAPCAPASEASRPTTAAVDDISALDTRKILNAAVSRGCAPIVELLLQAAALPPGLDVLSLDGTNLPHDVNGMLQCFDLLHSTLSDVSTFEACNFSSSSFSPKSAVAILGSLPVDRTRIRTLKLRKFGVDDGVLQFCCKSFPSLTCLDVGENTALLNVPSEIHLLTRLTQLNVRHCGSLISLPDELLMLKSSLTSISADSCTSIVYPPPTIMNSGVKSIFKYLADAENAEPLRRVKVMFLGNGRSGKTSILSALARQPLQPGDAGPDSTVGVKVDAVLQELKPTGLQKIANFFQKSPDITCWDFAGQLEYSAAHDFFMSSRQAVYVIVFSVMEDRDSRMHQVAYERRA